MRSVQLVDPLVPDHFLCLSAPLGATTPGAALPPPDSPSSSRAHAPACAARSASACAETFHTDRWRDGDIARAAALMHAAYPHTVGRHFAPHGRAEEWLAYVRALVDDGPCGPLDLESTRVIRDGDALRGVALVTVMAPATAHLAQLAVHPQARRRGLAAHLVREAAARAAAAGRGELTLLVEESNIGARRLYESLGFTPAGMWGDRPRIVPS